MTWTQSFMQAELRSSFSVYCFLNSFPKVYCCLRPTGVISPQFYLVSLPSYKSLTWYRAPQDMMATAWYNFISATVTKPRISRIVIILSIFCFQLIKIIAPKVMSEENGNDYTNLNFLTSLRSPKRSNLKRFLSVNTDLKEIDQILKSPRGITKKKIPESLETEKTKRFFMEVMKRYESQEEVLKKWEGFLGSVSPEGDFQKFFQTLKEIRSQPIMEINKPNPEKITTIEIEKEQDTQQGNKKSDKLLTRTFSTSKIVSIDPQSQKKALIYKLKQKIHFQLQEIKDLMMAGERFIRNI